MKWPCPLRPPSAGFFTSMPSIFDQAVGKRKPADLAACGFMECGAGIVAGRQLRRMQPVFLKTLSLSETAWVG